MDIVNQYKELNESFEKVMVYHIGIDAGFFTEYTYMLNAMLFCLQNKIKFVLYSDDANFRCEKGWTDYFESFCEEVHDDFHHFYNKHRLPSWIRILKDMDWTVAKWKLKCSYLNIMGSLYVRKYYGKHVLLNHSVKFDSKQHFYVPELGIDGGYLEAFKVMVDITWRLNLSIKNEVLGLMEELHLPDRYVGCQIRGGDKVIETELLSPVHYYKILCNKDNSFKDVFVLTDDICIYQLLQKDYPRIHWYTLCSSNEKGYVNSSFSRRMGKKKKEQMIRFIASMEILKHSSFFIGSITTGPSLFLLKLFYPNHLPVDCSLEQFDEVYSLSMSERCKIAKDYLNND